MGITGVTRPTLSITVPLAGKCYHLVAKAMEKLEPASLGHLGSPHFTLQTIYNDIDEHQAMNMLRRIAAETDAVEATARGFDVLGVPQDECLRYIYLRVVKTAALAEMYRKVKGEFQAIGAITNPYDSQEWIPHLSIASGRWTPEQTRTLVDTLSTEFGESMLSCAFLIRMLQLHKMHNDGTWTIVGEATLRNPSLRVR